MKRLARRCQSLQQRVVMRWLTPMISAERNIFFSHTLSPLSFVVLLVSRSSMATSAPGYSTATINSNVVSQSPGQHDAEEIAQILPCYRSRHTTHHDCDSRETAPRHRRSIPATRTTLRLSRIICATFDLVTAYSPQAVNTAPKTPPPWCDKTH